MQLSLVHETDLHELFSHYQLSQ